jgi:Leucine-rich repeat (LRR) protein
VTSDLSKLVGLEILSLCYNSVVPQLPESISCLEKLSELHINGGLIKDLPAGLATLPALTTLWMCYCPGMSISPDLQVTDTQCLGKLKVL